MSGSTDWLSAIGILLSGLVLGVMFIYVYVRRKQNTAAAPEADLELKELQARRDALIQQLRELDDEGVTEGEERRRLELKTAEVLKALDGYKPAKKKTAPPIAAASPAAQPAAAAPSGFFARNPAVKGFIWGVASIVAVAGLGYYVYSSAHDRNAGDSPTGGAMAGNMAAQQQGLPPQHPTAGQTNDPMIKQLEAEVAGSPDDVDKRIALTRAYLDRDNLMGVFEQTKAVLAKNPNEPRAQTYNAIVRMSMGQLGEAKSMLQTASKTDPSITDAWVALAFIATQEGKPADADAAINAAVKAHPEQEKRLREVLTEMRSHPVAPAQPLPPGTDTASLPEGHPGVPANGAAPNMASAAGMGAVPAAAPAADAVHITLDIAPKAQPKSGVVFVFARPEGQAGGPPVAVKRLNVASFPTTLDLSSSDSMMGNPLPEKIHIEARLSTTGTADGASIADPRAVADGVATKSTVKMTLK